MHSIFNAPDGILKSEFDPYWDAPITRREVQTAINEICINEQALTNRSDTANVVLNFIVEKLGITRQELDEYVKKKKEDAAILSEAHRLRAEEAKVNEQPAR